MVIHGSERMYVEDKSVNNHPKQTVNHHGLDKGVAPTQEQLSLSKIVQRFKSLTTHRYMIGVRDKGWPRFEKRLWQRNYYEHVIRNERDYRANYDYILANPMNWEEDEEFFAS